MREPYIVERHAMMVSNDCVLLLFTVKTKAVLEGYKKGQSLKGAVSRNLPKFQQKELPLN